jgi:hypothetical protein
MESKMMIRVAPQGFKRKHKQEPSLYSELACHHWLSISSIKEETSYYPSLTEAALAINLRIMPESSTSQRAPARTKRNLTNTNSDNLCKNDGPIGVWLYRFNLWTGLYMLNPYERLAFHIVFWFSMSVSLLYFSVFWSGFMEGMRQAS